MNYKSINQSRSFCWRHGVLLKFFYHPLAGVDGLKPGLWSRIWSRIWSHWSRVLLRSQSRQNLGTLSRNSGSFRGRSRSWLILLNFWLELLLVSTELGICGELESELQFFRSRCRSWGRSCFIRSLISQPCLNVKFLWSIFNFLPIKKQLYLILSWIYFDFA